jgi:hypothetical protein
MKDSFLGGWAAKRYPRLATEPCGSGTPKPPKTEELYWRLAGGTMPFKRRYSTICP